LLHLLVFKHIFTGILIFKGLNARRLYKSLGIKGLRTVWQLGGLMNTVTWLRAGQYGVGNVLFSITSWSFLFHGHWDPFYFF
jgi:hypothetical protein